MRQCSPLRLFLLAAAASIIAWSSASAGIDANRLTHLDEFCDPYAVGAQFPKLITPQWIGQEGVNLAVILSIDDMSGHHPYEEFLRPLLDRLKKVDGQAAVSIMCNQPDPDEPHLQKWLAEGVALETHTVNHPCPLLSGGDFQAAHDNYHLCVDNLKSIPNSTTVAYRMTCFDSINNANPRFYAELFNKTSPAGNFLEISSSICVLYTEDDPEQPAGYATDDDGRRKFGKYARSDQVWVNHVLNYPYPYVVGRTCWEAPSQVPDDWQGQHLHGVHNPITVEDMKASIDATARKKGLHTLTFHPHAWIRNDQLIDIVDHTVNTYGKRARFLTFPRLREKLTNNLLAGQPLRHQENGQDNGVRLLDLDGDGYLDVLIGNENLRRTRVWNAQANRWHDSDFPVALVRVLADGTRVDAGARFGIVQAECQKDDKRDNFAVMIVASDEARGGWRFDGAGWQQDDTLLSGLRIEGREVMTHEAGRDRGVRLRDLDRDGVCELIVSNESHSAVFKWIPCRKTWSILPVKLPAGAAIVDAYGRDAGLRFVDVDEDGRDDIVFSDPHRYGVYLFEGLDRGWSKVAVEGVRGEKDPAQEIPMIVRADGTNNGAWFSYRHMWIQNEDTDRLPDLVDHRAFDWMLRDVPPEPKSPQASHAAIVVGDNHEVELVAAEPLTMDPIAFDWGPDGRLWIVEMADYPLGLDGRGQPGGRIRFLEDTDGDGKYDRSTLFMEGVGYPTGVMPWGEGVLVTAAPEVFYAQDTDGDGKADVKRVLFDGFGEANQQHRANGLRWGLDNWVHIANGDSGGHVRSIATGKVVDISGRDLRVRPDSGEIEATTGMTQFGRSQDDAGNWFGCNNSFPNYHFALADHYLRRNPFVAPPHPVVMVSTLHDSPIHPIGRILSHFSGYTPPPPGQPSRFSAACGVTFYRDDLFGPRFSGNSLVCDPVHNLIHRRIIEPAGVTFTSRKPQDESRREFLASRDSWFRPTTVRPGPDGAIWVSDMYRLVIEHPEWIDDTVEKTLDLRAGHDRGRIYRVYPRDRGPRAIPRMDRLSPAQLAQVLESPSGWQRDAAQRMIVTGRLRQAEAPLRSLLRASAVPLARVHAICALEGLGVLTDADVLAGLADLDPVVRRHAVRLAEGFSDSPSRALVSALLEREVDEDLHVRMQLAYSIGQFRDATLGRALGRLAAAHVDDPLFTAACVSSALPHVSQMVEGMLAGADSLDAVAPLADQLISTALGAQQDATTARLIALIAQPREGDYADWQFRSLSRLFHSLDRAERTVTDLPDGESLGENVEKLAAAARRIAANSDEPVDRRAVAIGVLGHHDAALTQDMATLARLLEEDQPGALQDSAVSALGRVRDTRVYDVLLDQWPRVAPGAREGVLGVFLRRQGGAEALLGAVEGSRIAIAELGATYLQRLRQHPAASLRERIEAVVAAGASRPRQEVIDEYLPLVNAAHGDAQRGIALFSQHCAQCHKVGTVGHGAGPDLAALVDKSADFIVTHVLDPNRAIEDKYLSYSLETFHGELFTGLLVSETGASVTLRDLSGADHSVLKEDIVEGTFVRSTASMMPGGFEMFLRPADLADIIAFVNANLSAPKTFDGNQPRLVRPEQDGSLRLLASNGELYGSQLRYSTEYDCLAYWSADDDQVIWSVQVPKPGTYEIWLEWAEHEGSAGQPFAIVGSVDRFEDRVPSTGTWGNFERKRFGAMTFRSGVQRVVMRPTQRIEGALIDLREIHLVPAPQ